MNNRTCYGCQKLTSKIDGAGYKEYYCSDYPGIVLAEQDIDNQEDPEPFDNCWRDGNQ
jgi:hypothetical protein